MPSCFETSFISFVAALHRYMSESAVVRAFENASHFPSSEIAPRS